MQNYLPPCAFGCTQNTIGEWDQSRTIGTDFKFSKVIFMCKGCDCSSPPLICHPCRSRNRVTICRFCKNIGVASTIKKPSYEDLKQVRCWHNLRKRGQHSLPIQCRSVGKQMQESWGVFLRMYNLQYQTNHFKEWLRFQSIGRVNSFYQVSSRQQLLSQRNLTLVRMLIARLYRDNATFDRSNFLKRSYSQSRRIYLSENVLFYVLRRILATNAWFQDICRQSQ
jgi:hypothetical protein